MLRHSYARRTFAAAALLAALLTPIDVTAAPPEQPDAAEAGPSEVLLNLWQFIRDLFEITSTPDAGPERDLNVLAAGAASGGGDEAEEQAVVGVGEQPTASTNSEGDEGPHMDPNG